MDAYASQLLSNVIRPTIAYLNSAYAETKAWLLLGTATVSSQVPEVRPWPVTFGMYGLTHIDHMRIWDDYLAKDPDRASIVRGLASQHRFLQAPDEELNTNLAYATAIALVIYEEAIPTWRDTTDPDYLASLWETGFKPHFDRKPEQFGRLLGSELQRENTAAA